MKKIKLQKISKTVLSFALVCMLVLGHAASVSAAENNNSYVPTVTPEIVAEELGISLHEAENLEENLNKAVAQLPDLEVGANSHFPRPAGPHFPASQGHIKRSALEIGRARGAPPC